MGLLGLDICFMVIFGYVFRLYLSTSVDHDLMDVCIAIAMKRKGQGRVGRDAEIEARGSKMRART